MTTIRYRIQDCSWLTDGFTSTSYTQIIPNTASHADALIETHRAPERAGNCCCRLVIVIPRSRQAPISHIKKFTIVLLQTALQTVPLLVTFVAVVGTPNTFKGLWMAIGTWWTRFEARFLKEEVS